MDVQRLAVANLVGLTGVLLWAGAAAAQAPPQPCAAMKDVVGCSCAVATGGMVSGTAWARGPDQAAFEACLVARGGKPSARPSSIPARR